MPGIIFLNPFYGLGVCLADIAICKFFRVVVQQGRAYMLLYILGMGFLKSALQRFSDGTRLDLEAFCSQELDDVCVDVPCAHLEQNIRCTAF